MIQVNRYEHLTELLCHYHDEKEIVLLDAGHGKGPLLECLTKARSNWRLFGFDMDRARVDLVGRKLSNVTTRRCSILRVEYPSDFADVVVCSEVLEHLTEEELPTAAGELNRLLKAKGLLLLTTPYVQATPERMERLGHKSFVTVEKIRGLFPEYFLVTQELIYKTNPADPNLVVLLRKK